ncbi:SDR family oxidoreductase [Haloferula sp. BvORR071]|uniref:SDR family oxidoreductase n=1 Tax=Haloferula sp. BvORR071 TaxID=1396141 RepID=UPI000B097EA1|nr:SDR family oxidoreductase [Haloferula sp. BvORR071]
MSGSPTGKMKIVIIGGSGRIGSRLAKVLGDKGHEVIAASPSSGVNTVTGEGVAEALVDADVVVDVANSPSFEDAAVLEFFTKSGKHLMPAEKTAGVRHHIALSVVGTDRMLASGYFRGKMAQEELIAASEVPYTIVRATQFFDFAAAISKTAAQGKTITVPPALMQPMSSDDVASMLADVVHSEPHNGMVEIAGPEPIRQDEFVREYLAASGDEVTVVADPKAMYFGSAVNDRSLIPGAHARHGKVRYKDWLKETVAMAHAAK